MTARDYWHFFFGPEFAGILFLVAGLKHFQRELSFTRDGLLPLGRVFVPLALAVFGAEHLTSAKDLMQGVPVWMPARLFWAYFVGFALIAAAVSIVSGKYLRWSSALLSLMLLLFVVCIHVPNAVAHPGDRFRWAVAARDLLFSFGAGALAASLFRARRLLAVFRVVIALVLVFFAIEHLLHPQFLPGVPLEQQTLAWIPLRPLWGFIEGTMLLAGGVLILINRRAREAATSVAAVTTVMVILLYIPLFVVARTPLEIITAINYIADTLLFAGAVLLLAAAVPATQAHVPETAVASLANLR